MIEIPVITNWPAIKPMKKTELLKAIQDEIGRHSLATFWDKENGVTQVGCDVCMKVFGTNQSYKRHLVKTCYRRCWISFRLKGARDGVLNCTQIAPDTNVLYCSLPCSTVINGCVFS